MYRNYRGHGISPAWVIIGINVVIFIVTSLNPTFVYYNFGLIPQDLTRRPWVILTSIFIHRGLWHLITNMWTLYFFSNLLSSIIGNKRYLVIYFVGGILGGIFYSLIAAPVSIAVGASGAIFALGGALAVLRSDLKVYIFPIPVPMPMWVAVIGGFFIISLFPGIAWQAHLGGLVAGIIGGYIFKRQRSFF